MNKIAAFASSIQPMLFLEAARAKELTRSTTKDMNSTKKSSRLTSNSRSTSVPSVK